MFQITNEEFKTYTIPKTLDFYNVDLLKFIQSFAQQTAKDKAKSTKNAIIYRDSFGHKILVYPKTNTYRNIDNHDDKGGIYNFIINRLDNNFSIKTNPTNVEKRKTLILISKFLNNSNINISIKNKTSNNDKNSQKFDVKLKPIFNYKYLESRGIKLKTINNQIFKNRIFQGYLINKENNQIYNVPNTAFPLYNNNRICGAVLRNKNFKNNSNFKSIIGNHVYFWHSKKIENPTSLNFFESEIDALSYFQIKNNQLKKPIFISTHGNLYQKLFDNITNFINNFDLSKTKINLCFDKDFSGFQFDFTILNYFLSLNKKQPIEEIILEKKTNQYFLNMKLNDNYSHKFDIINFSKIFANAEIPNDYKIKFPYFSFPFSNSDNSKENNFKILDNVFSFIKKNYINNINLNLDKSNHKDWNMDLEKEITKKKAFKL